MPFRALARNGTKIKIHEFTDFNTYTTMKNILFLSTIITLLCGCKTSIDNNDNFLFDSNIPVCTSETKLSDIISIKRIVPLETNDESLVGEYVGKIQKQGNRFYISFNRNTLLAFDENGKYLNKIGGVGQGPGEYNYLGDYDVTDEAVYIRDVEKVHSYKHDGTYLNTTHIDGIFGMNVAGDKILAFFNNDSLVSHILTLDGEHINKHHPTSKVATIGRSSYYWPYKEGKYIFPFSCCNDALIYDTQKNAYSYMQFIGLPDMLTTDRYNQLLTEKGFSGNVRDYARVVWPFNSNRSQMFIGTPKGKEEGILWIKDLNTDESKAYDIAYLKNDVTFTSQWYRIFSGFARADNSFIAYIMPYELKEALQEKEDWHTESPFYKQMKELADSLSDEDNFILIEYQFK